MKRQLLTMRSILLPMFLGLAFSCAQADEPWIYNAPGTYTEIGNVTYAPEGTYTAFGNTTYGPTGTYTTIGNTTYGPKSTCTVIGNSTYCN